MCKNCQLKPVYEFTNKRKLCRICFIKYFQKKVLYTIRRFSMIKQNDTPRARESQEGTRPLRGVLGYKKANDFRGVVLEDVLRMFAERAMVKLVKLPSKKKIDKIAVPSTIDLEADKIIYTLIKGKASQLKKISPVNGKVIKPLYLFLDEEVLLYAKLRKLKFKKVEETPQAYTTSLCSQCKNLSRGPEYQRHDSSKDDSGEPSTEPKSSVKIFTRGKNLDKIAVASTIDLEAEKIIHTLIKGKASQLKKISPVNGKVIKPLYLFLDEEVLLYAKLRKLKFKKEKREKDKISIFIDELEKKHPEVKRAVVNSYLNLS